MSCMSVIPYLTMSVRSRPIPNAKPEYFLVSTPQVANTFSLTIPQPPHSIQRPLKKTSTSADGSVNGKNDGLNLVVTSLPKTDLAK